MKKKAYIIPNSTVVYVQTATLIAYSGGGKGASDPIVDPNADDSNNPNRSRRHRYQWDDEEEEW